jgi:hypothetical protein
MPWTSLLHAMDIAIAISMAWSTVSMPWIVKNFHGMDER